MNHICTTGQCIKTQIVGFSQKDKKLCRKNYFPNWKSLPISVNNLGADKSFQDVKTGNDLMDIIERHTGKKELKKALSFIQKRYLVTQSYQSLAG